MCQRQEKKRDVPGGSAQKRDRAAVDVTRRLRGHDVLAPQPQRMIYLAQISKVVLNCVIILRMVGGDVVYEKEIRSTLGNNPDTSKALRL